MNPPPDVGRIVGVKRQLELADMKLELKDEINRRIEYHFKTRFIVRTVLGAIIAGLVGWLLKTSFDTKIQKAFTAKNVQNMIDDFAASHVMPKLNQLTRNIENVSAHDMLRVNEQISHVATNVARLGLLQKTDSKNESFS